MLQLNCFFSLVLLNALLLEVLQKQFSNRIRILEGSEWIACSGWAHRSSSMAWRNSALFFCLKTNKQSAEAHCAPLKFVSSFGSNLLLSINKLLIRLLMLASAWRTFSRTSCLSASWDLCCRLKPWSTRSCSWNSRAGHSSLHPKDLHPT